jgi:universal stress protein A
MKIRASPRRRHRLTVELGENDRPVPALSSEVRLARILVPTDFSECSRHAVRYALWFAEQFGGEILMVHVVEPLSVPPPSMSLLIPASLERQRREEAAKKLAEWRREIDPGNVKTHVRTGTPYQEVIAAAEETNTDLIVIATRGHSKFAQWFLGSTTERVVRHAPCPVFVVREREHEFIPDAAFQAGAVRSTQPEKPLSKRIFRRSKS